ncbi:hypothetical protein TB2_023497 [Malus domestica]
MAYISKGRYSKFESIVFFFYLYRGNIIIVRAGNSNGNCNVIPLDIFSYTTSLIPLRKYGKLGREAALQGKTVFRTKYLATEVGQGLTYKMKLARSLYHEDFATPLLLKQVGSSTLSITV